MRWATLGAITLALFVGAGAFGAHSLRHHLSPPALRWWETAARYQAVHGLALFVVAWLSERRLPVEGPGWLFLAGLVFFCGSLYLMALTGRLWLGAVTPVGGSAWIAGWIWLAVVIARAPSASGSP